MTPHLWAQSIYSRYAATERFIDIVFPMYSLMKLLLLGTAIFIGQLQTSQKEEVVRLPPHKTSIPVSSGGTMVELLYAEPSLYLPKQIPEVDTLGEIWHVDVKNLGPGDVTLQGVGGFSVRLQPNQVVRIRTAGNTYSVARP